MRWEALCLGGLLRRRADLTLRRCRLRHLDPGGPGSAGALPYSRCDRGRSPLGPPRLGFTRAFEVPAARAATNVATVWWSTPVSSAALR